MDWNLKGGSWDLSELDEGGLPNIETAVDNYNGSTRFGILKGSGGEFCVDLKLGQVGNSGTEPSGPKWKVTAAAGGGGGGGGMSKAAVAATSGSSKRARAINSGTQVASCLVDGCSSDLSNCREYHRRHKVCELHSKTPVVTIGGHKQRFCQQCSRFHSLEEFDEGKRSCRKRLDGHNRRRRKPQPVPLTRSATLFSNYHQGRQLLPFSSDSNLYPSCAMVNPGCDWEWYGTTMVHRHHHHHHHHNSKQQIFLGSSESARIMKQEMTTYLEKPCVEAPRTTTTTAARPAGSFSSPPPPCALSLLSSPTSPMYLSQPLAPTSLHDHGLQEAVDTTLLVSNGTQPPMYNLSGSDASQGIHTSQSLPFHWE